jgi:hypothetical protein
VIAGLGLCEGCRLDRANMEPPGPRQDRAVALSDSQAAMEARFELQDREAG